MGQNPVSLVNIKIAMDVHPLWICIYRYWSIARKELALANVRKALRDKSGSLLVGEGYVQKYIYIYILWFLYVKYMHNCTIVNLLGQILTLGI